MNIKRKVLHNSCLRMYTFPYKLSGITKEDQKTQWSNAHPFDRQDLSTKPPQYDTYATKDKLRRFGKILTQKYIDVQRLTLPAGSNNTDIIHILIDNPEQWDQIEECMQDIFCLTIQ